MTRMLDHLFGAAAALAATLLAMIGVLTLVEILGRNVFGFLTPLGTEFGGFAMAASIFLGLGWTLRNGGHVRVSLLLHMVNNRIRHAVEIWCLTFAALIIAVLAYSVSVLVWNSYLFDARAMGLVALPLWIPQFVMMIGVLLLEVAILEQLLRVLGGREPSYRLSNAIEDDTEL